MAHLTRNEVLSSGVVSPIYQAAFEARPVEISGTDIASWRTSRAEHLQKLRHSYPIPGPIPDSVYETLHDVPARDGKSIRVKVYQPARAHPEGRKSPLIMMFHEGAWMMGDLTDEDLNCRMFARDLGAVCVNVEYRYMPADSNECIPRLTCPSLAPEHPFPTGVNDCYDALLWATSNASTLNADPKHGLIVGGASAGGNLAAVLALLSRDNKLSPPITGQYLCVPALLPDTNVPAHLAHLYTSRLQNIHDPVLKGGLQPGGVEAIYAPETKSPLWDPYSHPDGHAGVARAFFQVGGLDPLRDEAVLYDRKLREAGVMTRFELYGGYGHMFWTNFPELEESGRFVRDTLRGVKWLLEG